jgi:hypothetical protein
MEYLLLRRFKDTLTWDVLKFNTLKSNRPIIRYPWMKLSFFFFSFFFFSFFSYEVGLTLCNCLLVMEVWSSSRCFLSACFTDQVSCGCALQEAHSNLLTNQNAALLQETHIKPAKPIRIQHKPNWAPSALLEESIKFPQTDI